MNTLSQSVFLDVTSITNLGILAGAFWIAAGKSRSSARPMTATQWIVGFVSGFLLGYSSRLSFGCHNAAMASGYSTGSLPSRIWVQMAFMGALFGEIGRAWGRERECHDV